MEIYATKLKKGRQTPIKNTNTIYTYTTLKYTLQRSFTILRPKFKICHLYKEGNKNLPAACVLLVVYEYFM